MSMGAGIGGFVQGLAQGINTREGFEDRRERRLERQERREERARTRANEESISAIGRRATDEIAAGGDRREIEERYWREIQDEYARQGKPESARQFQQWRQSDETQRGIRLFQNSLMLFDQARRADGSYDPRMMQLGLRELQRAQAIPSYGGDRNIRLRPIIEGEGEAERFVGVRFEYRGDDGQTASRDIAAGEIPRAAATFFNPQAAFEDRQKQDQERRQQQERQRSEQRTDWQAAEGQVRKEYEERRDPAQQAQDRAAGRTPVTRPWDDLTADERDTLIRNRQTARTPPAQRQALGLGGLGAGAPTPGRVAFDTVTGAPVAPSARPTSPSQAAAPQVTAPTPGPGSTTPAPTAAVAPPPQSPVAAEAARIDQVRADAEGALRRGEEPDVVARGLARAGIPQDQWPESVRAGLQRRQQTMPAGTPSPGLAGLGDRFAERVP